MGYYIIIYNILLLFRGLFISGGLRPPPKWPIASAGPALNRESDTTTSEFDIAARPYGW